MRALAVEFRIRYWGGVSKRNIRTLGIYRQYKIRVCRECHRILRTFDGYHDCTGSYIRYIRDDPVVVFAEDFDLVRNIFQSFKSRLRDEHLTIVDFSRMCPLTLCTLDLGLPMDDDLVMAGPFEEPDEYFPQETEGGVWKRNGGDSMNQSSSCLDSSTSMISRHASLSAGTLSVIVFHCSSGITL